MPVGAAIFFPTWYYWDKIKRFKIKDSTAIFLVILLPVILLIIGYGELLPFRTDNDRLGVIISAWIGLAVFIPCFYFVKKKELHVNNKSPKESAESK